MTAFDARFDKVVDDYSGPSSLGMANRLCDCEPIVFHAVFSSYLLAERLQLDSLSRSDGSDYSLYSAERNSLGIWRVRLLI